MIYAIKAPIHNLSAPTYRFEQQKTMYGGKHIAVNDEIFLFASEIEGGAGLFAWGIITAAEAIPLVPGIVRQTPCVSISVTRRGLATRRLGRKELKDFTDWDDGQAQTELNFKYYRQATNKIVGISSHTADFLRSCF